jgi:hypothetical protein
MASVGTFDLSVGETLTVDNTSKTAARYSVHFLGAGEVFFDVLPGAEFQIRRDGVGKIHLNIHSLSPSGIHPAGNGNATGE